MTEFDTVGAIVENLSAFAGRPAVISFSRSGTSTLSYGQLCARAQAMARQLARAGVGRGDRVLLTAPNSPAWIAACLGAIKLGAIVVPLDAHLDEDTLAYILQDVQAKAILADGERADCLKRCTSGLLPAMVPVDGGPESGDLPASPEDDRNGQAEANDVVAMFYTSGTTGKPKGVPLTSANLIFQLKTLTAIGITRASDRFFLPLPMHHIYPFAIGLLLPLSSGLPVILPESLTGPKLTQAIKEGGATVLIGVPRLYGAIWAAIESRLDSLRAPQRLLARAAIKAAIWLRRHLGLRAGRVLFKELHGRIGPDIRVLACGGAALDADLGWSLEGLGWQVAIGYGLTETSPLLTMKAPERGSPDNAGRPLPGVEIRIDHQSWISQLPGQAELTEARSALWGEVQARGPGVFSGYYNLPEKTAEAFTGDHWFKTGDLGYFDDGCLHVLGRFSSLIVTESGKKIDPEDLEQFYAQHPFIKEIGILQYQGKLTALVVPDLQAIKSAGGGDIDRLLRDAVDERALNLPHYKRLSGYAVCRQGLARTAMGKIQRHRLKDDYELARKGEAAGRKAEPAELSDEDRALVEGKAGRAVLTLLRRRFPGKTIALDASPQLDLGVDSLEWLTLTLDIRHAAGADLEEDAVARISTVRDLINEVIAATDRAPAAQGLAPLADPDASLSAEQKIWLEPLSPFLSLCQRLFFAVNRLVVKSVFRLQVVGLENLPSCPQLVYTPNHASYIDAFVLAAALPTPRLAACHWAGWTGIAFANPFNRFVSKLARAIPIDADRALVSSLALAASVLKRGRSLIWFPEGRRTLTGELLEFKAGIGLVLERYPVPVVPIYLQGTGAALPPGDWRLRPGEITVVFGRPALPDELYGEGEGESPHERIASGLRNRVRALKP